MNRVPAIANDSQLRPALRGSIRFKGVHFTYPSRPQNAVLEVLPSFGTVQNLTFEVLAGETVVLVSPSGASKSSVVALLQHFYEPQLGRVLLDDVPLGDLDHDFFHEVFPKFQTRQVALVGQEPVLYAASVRANILYGCDSGDEHQILTAARAANAHNFVMDLEDGYETKCGEKGVQMSGEWGEGRPDRRAEATHRYSTGARPETGAAPFR